MIADKVVTAPPLFTQKIGLEVSPTLLGNQRVVERRAKGDTVYHMGFGESPFPVAPRLQEALSREAHHKQYLNTAGLPALREKVRAYLCALYELNPDDYDVIIAPGSKMFIFAMQMAYQGDLVMPVPSWVSYIPQAKLLQQNVVKVPALLDDDGYHINAVALEDAIKEARTRGLNPSKIILNSPNNPTGLCIPENELAAIAEVCERQNIMIIADDIYRQVTFTNMPNSIARYAPGKTIISGALSKHLSLGGWRLGFGLVPKAIDGLYDSLCQIASETWSAVAAPIQYAALEAFEGHQDIEDWINDCSALHGHMNSYVAKRLKAMGVICAAPQGAFYTYPDFAPFKEGLEKQGIKTSNALFTHLIDEYSIAALPGISFGEKPERLTLRLSGCDYDGGLALEAYRDGKALDEDFIAEHAPHIKKGCDAFARFVEAAG